MPAGRPTPNLVRNSRPFLSPQPAPLLFLRQATIFLSDFWTGPLPTPSVTLNRSNLNRSVRRDRKDSAQSARTTQSPLTSPPSKATGAYHQRSLKEIGKTRRPDPLFQPRIRSERVDRHKTRWSRAAGPRPDLTGSQRSTKRSYSRTRVPLPLLTRRRCNLTRRAHAPPSKRPQAVHAPPLQ